MIVINITINIAPQFLESQLYHERMYQELKAIQADHDARQRAAIEELDTRTFKAICPKCGWMNNGYPTPGRAKMGLSAHLQRCRR